MQKRYLSLWINVVYHLYISSSTKDIVVSSTKVEHQTIETTPPFSPPTRKDQNGYCYKLAPMSTEGTSYLFGFEIFPFWTFQRKDQVNHMLRTFVCFS